MSERVKCPLGHEFEVSRSSEEERAGSTLWSSEKPDDDRGKRARIKTWGFLPNTPYAIRGNDFYYRDDYLVCPSCGVVFRSQDKK